MKKNRYLLLFIAVVFLTLNSCSSGLDDNVSVDYKDNSFTASSFASPVLLRINSEIFKTINTNRLNNTNTGDSFKINSAKRTNDMLEVSVSYSGGCKQHSFEVIWDGIVYTDDPCHMNLMLIHNSNKDECEAFVTETIRINLKELIGDVVYKNSCEYHIFNTNNSNDKADFIIKSIN